jgi:hypothetical protein
MANETGAAAAAAGTEVKPGAAPTGAVAATGATKEAPAAATNGNDNVGKPAAPGGDDGSLLGAGEPGEGATPAADYPADWRERNARAIAGKDEKLFEKTLAKLKRFVSPENVTKWGFEADAKIRSGQFKRTAPGEDATPEELAEWRKEAGIPDTPDKYEIGMPGGAEPSEADKAVLDHFKGVFHKHNIPPAEAKGLVDDFYAHQAELAAARREAARDTLINNRAALKSEFGADYGRNVALAKSWLDGVAGGEEGRNTLANLPLADGTTLGDNPAFVKLVVQAALAQGDDGALAQAEFGAGGGGGLQTQYDALIKMSVDQPDEYAKPENQKKVMQLAAAIAKGKNRSAA